MHSNYTKGRGLIFQSITLAHWDGLKSFAWTELVRAGKPSIMCVKETLPATSFPVHAIVFSPLGRSKVMDWKIKSLYFV